MSNRVVLVNGNQAAADGAAEFILAFLIGFSILHSLMKHKILLKWTKRLGGVVVFSFLLMPFWDTTSRILKVSGWL